MTLDGIFQCVRCHGTRTGLMIVQGEGTVCADQEACKLIRKLGDDG